MSPKVMGCVWYRVLARRWRESPLVRVTLIGGWASRLNRAIFSARLREHRSGSSSSCLSFSTFPSIAETCLEPRVSWESCACWISCAACIRELEVFCKDACRLRRGMKRQTGNDGQNEGRLRRRACELTSGVIPLRHWHRSECAYKLEEVYRWTIKDYCSCKVTSLLNDAKFDAEPQTTPGIHVNWDHEFDH